MHLLFGIIKMIWYLSLKYLHAGLALLSVSGFALRWFWMCRGSPLLEHTITRRLPHIIDSLFLLTGIILALAISQYPFVHDWLTAKVIGLVLYIIFGTLALKRAPNLIWKSFFFVLALATFAYILGVARTWNTASWLTLFTGA